MYKNHFCFCKQVELKESYLSYLVEFQFCFFNGRHKYSHITQHFLLSAVDIPKHFRLFTLPHIMLLSSGPNNQENGTNIQQLMSPLHIRIPHKTLMYVSCHTQLYYSQSETSLSTHTSVLSDWIPFFSSTDQIHIHV